MLGLLRETTAASRATDPETPLIFMTGPLAGTPAPSSSNHVVVSLNYDVPYAAGTGHSHGFWAARLKHAGHEGIIVKGRAASPVYLWIDDDRVELRDARALWGQDTRETERLIKRELGGNETEISVACIGPAGEARLHGASVKNDRNHGAGKGSPGAINHVYHPDFNGSFSLKDVLPAREVFSPQAVTDPVTYLPPHDAIGRMSAHRSSSCRLRSRR